MILSALQLEVTKKWLNDFSKSIEEDASADKTGIHPLIVKAYADSLVSMRDELQGEVAEYVSRTSVPTISFLNGMR